MGIGYSLDMATDITPQPAQTAVSIDSNGVSTDDKNTSIDSNTENISTSQDITPQ